MAVILSDFWMWMIKNQHWRCIRGERETEGNPIVKNWREHFEEMTSPDWEQRLAYCFWGAWFEFAFLDFFPVLLLGAAPGTVFLGGGVCWTWLGEDVELELNLSAFGFDFFDDWFWFWLWCWFWFWFWLEDEDFFDLLFWGINGGANFSTWPKGVTKPFLLFNIDDGLFVGIVRLESTLWLIELHPFVIVVAGGPLTFKGLETSFLEMLKSSLW